MLVSSSLCSPVPQWEVMADVWMHLPLPPWYLQYLQYHAPPPQHPRPPQEVPLEVHQQAPGGQLYPRT